MKLEVVEKARAQVDAWLAGSSEPFELDVRLFGRPDAWEALEMGDPDTFDLFIWLALACALVADERSTAAPPPEPIRHAPFEAQLLWLAASSTAPSRVRIGRTQIVVASDSLNERGLFEMSATELADEIARRHEYERAWHITDHTSSAKLAFHDWDGMFELRWNRGDSKSTILRFDDEKGYSEMLYPSDFVLRVVLGAKWPDDTSALKKRALSDWSPVHRRLWELAAFVCAHRSVEKLDGI